MAPLRRRLALSTLLAGTLLGGTAYAQDPPMSGNDPIAAAAAANGSAGDPSANDGVVVVSPKSPVVRAAPGNWGLSFSFGGLAPMSVFGFGSYPQGAAAPGAVPSVIFTEIGARAVLKSIYIPFSVGLGVFNNTSRPMTGPSTSVTDFGLAFSGGILYPFRVWRRISPYVGGMLHLSYVDPDGPDNWQVNLGLGPVLGVEYFVFDRVSLSFQGDFALGVLITSPAAQLALNTVISGGGRAQLNFYF
jgi:hypothetical protein